MNRLTCKDLIGFLDDYLDGQLEEDVLVEFERHLGRCPPCADYLRTYRDTIELTRAVCREDGKAPADAPQSLINAILAARKRARG